MTSVSHRHTPFAAILIGMTALLGTSTCGSAWAEWPDRSITIIVPFSAGGHTDMLGRLLAAQLGPRLGQSVKVENRISASQTFELSKSLQATAPGYTLGVTSNAMLINSTMDSLAYDPLKDFVPIAYLGAAPNVIVTRTSSGIISMGDLIAKAKANPGKLTYASPGVGTSSPLAVELLKIRAKIDIRHIAFDGSGMSLMAVLSGSTDIAALGTMGLMKHINAGELKALAQTGNARWVELPDVPTLAEAGIPNAVLETSFMFLAPPGTADQIISDLANKTREILQQSDTKAKLLETGFTVEYEGPDTVRARLGREMSTWNEIVERAGLKKKK